MDSAALRVRLVDLTIGCAGETCTVPAQPVAFGRRHWLAQHRWLEPLVGLLALLPIGAVYLVWIAVVLTAGATGLAA